MNQRKRPIDDPRLGLSDVGTGAAEAPSALDPWESTPGGDTAEGKVALEVLPSMQRATAIHAPIRGAGPASRLFWGLVLAAATVAIAAASVLLFG